jgi:flotillin
VEHIVAMQFEAITNLKIGKITVWDSGNGEKGGSSTAHFLSGMIKSLFPLQDIAEWPVSSSPNI